jgi:hypothetical protein
LKWDISFGSYDYERWLLQWQELFDNYDLIHNHITIKRVTFSEQKNGGFAIVDIYMLLRHKKNG